MDESSTPEDFSVVRQKSTRRVRRRLKHYNLYNLDAIISVGYRVNSTRATRFRQWATRVLRERLTQGLRPRPAPAGAGAGRTDPAMDLLSKTLVRQELVSDIGREVVGLGHAKTWRLLLDYDEGRLAVPAGARLARGVLNLGEARRTLDALAAELRSRGEASELFARDRSEDLAAILGNIEQTMFGEPLYKTCEERAA